MDANAFDLRNILQLFRRRWLLIVVVTAVSLATASIALFALKPVYTATTLVLVDPSKKNLLDPESQISGSSSDSYRVDSEAELVESETTLLQVAKDLNLASDPEFGVRIGMREQLLAFLRIAEPRAPSGDQALQVVMGNLRDAVTVQRRGLTFLIAVNARSGRPQFAADIANAVARSYIQAQLQAKVTSTLQSRDIIQARLADASSTVALSETAFDSFVDENLQRISEATGRNDLQTTRAEIERLTRARAQSASLADQAQLSLDTGDWATLATSLKDEALASLNQQRAYLENALNQAADGSQTAADLKASLAEIDANLKQRASTVVDALKSDLSKSQARATELRTQLRTDILDSNLPSDILTRIYGLQQQAEIARQQYQTLLTRQNDLDTQAFLQVADSRVVSEATPPSAPSFPNPRLILLASALVGIAVGIGLAFLIENYFGGFTSEQQAEALLKVPVATAIPRQRLRGRVNSDGLGVADSLIVSPLSVFSESIRRIRISVEQMIRRKPAVEGPPKGKVVIVSSAAPNEGKTTIALSLARAYALSGLSTLLIDCDLRKPSVHKQLGMESSEGLLEYLVGGAGDGFDLKTIMAVDGGSGARIVFGARRSDVATDQLISGKTFARLIAAAQNSFDVIVLDTPPVGPVVDGLYLAGMADAIVFVVKWSATPQQEVRSAIAALNSAKSPDTPLLAVLNQQDINPRAYRGKYAGYYAET